MTQAPNIDGVLITWGDRLFYPGNRVVKVKPQPKLKAGAASQRAAAIRQRIEATVVRRAPQVMIKVTGGGRGMKAIAAHFRYISKNGRLDIEDERGESMRGKDTLYDLADDWRFGGTLIDDVAEPGQRREAFNIMLSMPRGTDPLTVQRAAREFAQVELADHKYVMVLHDHQANPHVHISVRAESKHGKRLNPRKADLHRWRETFAEKLRGHGVETEATRQATRGRSRNFDPLWRLKAREDGRLRTHRAGAKSGAQAQATRAEAVEAWMHVGRALAMSGDPADRDLARSIASFIKEMPVAQARLHHLVELRGIGLVTGEVGSSKTTACRQLSAALHPGLFRVFYVPLSTGNVMDMYKAIAWQLGLPIERNRASAYRAIHSEVCRLATECRIHPVLVVDEAQHLRNDVLEDLRLLTNYDMDSQPRLCLLLVGLSELRRRLAMSVHESLAQRVVVRLHLGGLTGEELSAYVEHRLRLAGTSLPLFEPAALARAKQITAEHVQCALEELQ